MSNSLHTDSVWCTCPECGEAKLDPKVSTLPADLENTNVEYYKHTEPEKTEPRYTWTYGAGEGRTIFINDNSLPGPYRGIASLTCAKIGKEAAEHLAHAWCRALDMLATLQGVLPIIEDEAKSREIMEYAKGECGNYFTEMREASYSIKREIALAQGLLRQTCRRTLPGACEHGFKYAPCPECAKTAEPERFDHDEEELAPRPCPHGFAFTSCPECEKDADNYDYAADDRNFDEARERSMKR